jgi:hypothetical protein
METTIGGSLKSIHPRRPRDLYGPEMTIEKIPSTQWALNAVMPRPGKQARVLATVVLPKPELDEKEWRAYNLGLRDEAQVTQNVDKGFMHYITHYKQD